MANLLGVFFDANGNPARAVLTDDDNFAPHLDKNLTFLSVPVDVAGLLHDPHELKKACIPALTAIDKTLAAKAQSACDAVDAQRLIDKQAQAAAQAASLVAWNALTPAQRQALIDADALGVGAVVLGP